jgi:hypothetical protein
MAKLHRIGKFFGYVSLLIYPSTSCGTVISNCAEISQATGTCTLPISSCVQITAQNTDMAASISTTESSCGDCFGSATVTVNNGSAPYSYLWSNSQTTQTATGLCQGICELTVTDNNNCQTYAEGYVGSTTATSDWPFRPNSALGTAKVNDITTDNAGNVYITGYFTGTVGFGSYNLTSNGMEDVFFAKLDECGIVIWAKSFGSNRTDIGNSISVDNNGNYYVIGSFANPIVELSNYPTAIIDNAVNTFVVKYNSNNNLLWKARIDGYWTSYDQEVIGYSSDVDENGNIYIIGEYINCRLCCRDADFVFHYMDFFPCRYNIHPFVTKFSSDGDWEWNRSLGDDGYVSAYDDYSRSLTYKDGFVFAASKRQTGSSAITTRLYQLNAESGNTISISLNLSSGGTVHLNDVSVAPNPGIPTVYATGNKINAFGNSNAVVYKFSGTTQEWMKIDNADPLSAHIQSNGVAADNNGNVLIGGGFDENNYIFTGGDELTLDPGEAENPFVYMFDNTGNPMWGDELNGDGAARINAVTYSQGNVFYVAGYYTDELFFDDYTPQITLTTSSAPNAFVARVLNNNSSGGYRNAPAQSEQIFFEETISVFPNPAKEKVNISYLLSEGQQVEIFLTDLTGRVMYKNNFVAEPVGSTEINTSGLSGGMYILTVCTKQGKLTEMIMIE